MEKTNTEKARDIFSLMHDYGDNKKYLIQYTHNLLGYITFTVHRKRNLFGYTICKKIEEINMAIIDLPVLNDARLDRSVNFEAYTEYAAKGFNENPMPDWDQDALHCVSCMAEEMGEILGVINKHIYHGKPLDLVKFLSEAGDLKWYEANLYRLLGISLTQVLQGNILKLNERYPNGRDKNYLLQERNHDREDSIIRDKLFNGNSIRTKEGMTIENHGTGYVSAPK